MSALRSLSEMMRRLGIKREKDNSPQRTQMPPTAATQGTQNKIFYKKFY